MWRPLEFLLQHLPFSKFLLCFLLCLIVVLHHLPQTLAGAVLCSFPKYIEAVTGEKLNIVFEGITPGSEAFATFTHQHDNFECCIGDDRYCEPLRKNHVDGKCPSFDKNFDAARSTFNINISSMADEYDGYYQTFDTKNHGLPCGLKEICWDVEGSLCVTAACCICSCWCCIVGQKEDATERV